MAEDSSEVAQRMAKAERFKFAAEALARGGHSDACPSRAYYAAYHAAIAFLVSAGQGTDSAGRWRHGAVERMFRGLGGTRPARLYRYL